MKGPNTRERLLTLLAEACELEHALGCSYLFAAFSIKRDLSDGIDWKQQQVYRRWASQIYHIAAQEMLHLAQAWNLITAVGGAPYLGRPDFPISTRSFPLPRPLVLRRFDEATLERFVHYEMPAELVPDMPAVGDFDEAFEYRSVGDLYAECARIIEEGDSALFVGADDMQIHSGLVHFPDIIEVVDKRSALSAIERITRQGEGTLSDRSDSHWSVFASLLRELKEYGGHNVSHPVVDNPYIKRRRQDSARHRGWREIETNEVTDPVSAQSVDLFDDTYVAMLHALGFLFSNATRDEAHLQAFARVALELMTTVIKPLGEAICALPRGKSGGNAGPSFALWRFPVLPSHAGIARGVLHGRLQNLSERGFELTYGQETSAAFDKIRSAAQNLAQLAGVIED